MGFSMEQVGEHKAKLSDLSSSLNWVKGAIRPGQKEWGACDT